MLLKENIIIMDSFSLFSTKTNFKICDCAILPDENLFINYYLQIYQPICGCVVFIDTHKNKRAFLMNLLLSETSMAILEQFMQDKFSRDAFLEIL